MPKVDKKNKKDNEEKDFAHAVISWDSGAYRKLSVSLEISDFQKNTFCRF